MGTRLKQEGAVHLDRHLDLVVGDATVNFLERDAHLEPGESSAQAEMRPVSEGEMPLRAAQNVEAIRIGELTLVTVRRPAEQGHLLAFGDRLPVQ